MKLNTLGKLVEATFVIALIFTLIITKPYTGVKSQTQKGEGRVEVKSIEYSQIEPQLAGTIFGPAVVLTTSEEEKPVEPQVNAKVLLAASRTQAKTVTTRVVAETASQAAAPTPSSKPTAISAPSDILALIDKYSSEYGVNREAMIIIAKCESGFNTQAVGSGIYGGLYQFVTGTWISNRKAMGLDPDPTLRFNAEEAVKTAAFKMSRDGFGAWPVCGSKI